MEITLKNAVLLSAAMGIGAIGTGYLVAPAFMYGLYGMVLSSTDELNMVRGAYGGLFLAFSLLFAAGAFRPRLSVISLTALLTFMAGFALGRLSSIALDGSPHPLIWCLLLLELVYAALAGGLLYQHQQQGLGAPGR